MSAVDSFDELMKFAATGREYVFGEVWSVPGVENSASENVVGNGYDFEVPFAINPGNLQLIAGTVHLRVLHLTLEDQPMLVLRTRLEWLSPTEVKHTSSAYYRLDRSDAESLDAANIAPPTPEELAAGEAAFEEQYGTPEDITDDQVPDLINALFGAIMDAPGNHIQSDWVQAWEGQDTMDIGQSDTEYQHHEQVMVSVTRSGEPLICMLSDCEFGAVYAAELVTLWNWIKEHAVVNA